MTIVTTDELAVALGVSYQKILRWRRAGFVTLVDGGRRRPDGTYLPFTYDLEASVAFVTALRELKAARDAEPARAATLASKRKWWANHGRAWRAANGR